MTHWEVLGVAPDADIGTIKKAYAQKLKVTRPEDDLSGYTTLRCAYEAAIDASREEIASYSSPPEGFPSVHAEIEILDSHGGLVNSVYANAMDHLDPITLLNELHARMGSGESVADAISWLQHSDAFVNLNFQRALGTALIEEISDRLRWPHEALKAFGQLWNWLPDDDFYLDPPTTHFEALILRTWLRTVGEPICNRFFAGAKADEVAASAHVELELAKLEPEFRPILAQSFAWHMVNERHPARAILALEEVFAWHRTVAIDAFGAVLHRARMEHRIESMTRRDNLKRMVPRHRAMWMLKFRRGYWGVLRSMFDSRKIEMQKIVFEARDYQCDLVALFDTKQVQLFVVGSAIGADALKRGKQILLDVLIISAATTIQYFMVPELASIFVGIFIGGAIRIFMRLLMERKNLHT